MENVVGVVAENNTDLKEEAKQTLARYVDICPAGAGGEGEAQQEEEEPRQALALSLAQEEEEEEKKEEEEELRQACLSSSSFFCPCIWPWRRRNRRT